MANKLSPRMKAALAMGGLWWLHQQKKRHYDDITPEYMRRLTLYMNKYPDIEASIDAHGVCMRDRRNRARWAAVDLLRQEPGPPAALIATENASATTPDGLLLEGLYELHGFQPVGDLFEDGAALYKQLERALRAPAHRLLPA